MHRNINRRRFLQQSLLATSAVVASSGCSTPRKASANGKLNIGVIGVANQGRFNLNNVSSENIVALCDVDERLLAAAAADFPGAESYTDFRKMLDRRDLDAVVVATPDHTHAVATVWALQSGRHVYCEKPLARTISETRAITEAARRYRRVTQIGTQIHAGANYRRVVELIQSEAMGPIGEVHVWTAATYGGLEVPENHPPVPDGLRYDLWLGPIEPVPYSPEYVPFKWRNWWPFGGGALADFGCHYMDLPHWALDLRIPVSAEVIDGPPVHRASTPPWLIVRYQYPRRGLRQGLSLTWYHGGRRPELIDGPLASAWKSGVLFVGKKGMVLSDYSRYVLLPEKDFEGFQPPDPFISDSIGHHREWVLACKGEGRTTCGFEYSGPLTESVLLGNVAYRSGCAIAWDSEAMQAIGCPSAEPFIHHRYRPGWKL